VQGVAPANSTGSGAGAGFGSGAGAGAGAAAGFGNNAAAAAGSFGPDSTPPPSRRRRDDDEKKYSHDWQTTVSIQQDPVTGQEFVYWNDTVYAAVPEGFKVYRIMSNYFAANNATCMPVDANGSLARNHTCDGMGLIKVYKPGYKEQKLQDHAYVPHGQCTKTDQSQCIKYHKFLTEQECKDRMMDWDLYQVYVSKSLKAIDDINTSDIVSPAYPGNSA